MKKLSILVVLLLALSLLTVTIFAAQAAAVTVSTSTSIVSCGDTVTVTISTTPVNNCIVGGFLFDYDTSVFEYVNGYALVSDYSSANISTAEGNLAGYFMNGNTTVEGDIFQITLKVKNNAVTGDYNISGIASMVSAVNDVQENVTCSVAATTITVCNHTNNKCTDNGDGTHSVACSLCGTVSNPTEEHAFTDDTCACGATEAPELLNFISSTTAALNNSVALQFVIDPDLNDDNVLELIGDDNYVVIEKLNRETGEWEFFSNVPQSDWATYTNGRFVASCDLAAKQMTDQFKVVLYNSKDEQISYVWTDSGRAYGMRAVNTLINQVSNATKKKQLTMFVDFLNYCAAAQIQFNYYPNDLANSELTPAQQAYATGSVAPENLRNGDGKSQVSVESRIELSFLFDTNVVTQDMYGVITYTHFNGVAESVTIQGADFATYKSQWSLLAPNIATPDGNQLITCVIYDANGNEVARAQDSVNSYMARVLAASNASANLKALATAAVKLTTSSYAYFNK